MASKPGKKNRQSPKRPLRYFFINEQLHKKLVINRGKDTIITWNYPESKRVTYVYSDVLKRHKKAFTTTEVTKMVCRGRRTLIDAMDAGMIERPQNTYGLDENRNFQQYMWSEKDIMDLLDYLSTVHRGRPRKDGEITPQHLPTPRELRAMINDENVLYVKQGDTFVPTWRAKDF